MRGGSRKGWRWRVGDGAANEKLDLLYEPGNWGDILKGIWAERTTRVILDLKAGLSGETGAFRYLDPFAGAPTYPLVEASRRRIDQVHLDGFRGVQDPYTRRGLLASTAVLVQETAKLHGVEASLEVFDSDPRRAESWRGVAGARVLDATSGESVLERLEDDEGPPDLVLVDPYDFFVRWQVLLPLVDRASRRSTVLVYLYNKSPRGPGQQRLYEDFRRALRKALGPGRKSLVGRIPADPSLARAYHEVMVLAPPETLQLLSGELEEPTRALARALADLGAFEVLGPT